MKSKARHHPSSYFLLPRPPILPTQEMASSKLLALLIAFAVAAAATLPPSEATRVQGLNPAAAANHETPGGVAEQLSSNSGALAGGDAQHPSTSPAAGLPAGAPPLPGILGLILAFLFPPIAAIPGLLPPIPGLFPPLPPLPGSPPQQAGGVPGATSPPPTECMTPLMGVAPCIGYLTNFTVLTPPGECCDGFRLVARDAPICLCHGMNGGDMNGFLPRPVDPIRMAVLPLACGTVLPIQTLFMCSTQAVPPIVPPTTPAAPPVSP